ncbi:MAG: DUF1800 domain-containing protein [SAR202 cluster bacterium]|nr:DUF1800 domain-containing protein [SAR202 cluster bacterium]
MSNKEDIALMAHLLRRAGFGASREEIERRLEVGYDATVEELLHPEDQPDTDLALFLRYHPASERSSALPNSQLNWLYHMVMTQRPLEEKMTLFWHHVFATGYDKVESPTEMLDQINMLRESGMGNFKELLFKLAMNPTMIFWLDNNENHKRAPNENWGRELLELFSMGVGNYTEDDVKQCARAFTGWTIGYKIHWLLWGPHLWPFEYHPEDHDVGQKDFLGHSGNFNGEDIIEIVAQQPATAKFIGRHLYNFFIADEPQVPAWPFEKPKEPEVIDILTEAFIDSDFEIKPVLRLLFKSDFFKDAAFRKVRSPAEIVVGALKTSGDMHGPDPRWSAVTEEPTNMGQGLMNPPSVEGWHTGREWINSGAFVNRVNFAAEKVGDPSLPGIQDIVRRIAGSNGSAMTPETLVDACIDLLGPIQIKPETRDELITQVTPSGPISWSSVQNHGKSAQQVGDVLALIAGTREFQMG